MSNPLPTETETESADRRTLTQQINHLQQQLDKKKAVKTKKIRKLRTRACIIVGATVCDMSQPVKDSVIAAVVAKDRALAAALFAGRVEDLVE